MRQRCHGEAFGNDESDWEELGCLGITFLIAHFIQRILFAAALQHHGREK